MDNQIQEKADQIRREYYREWRKKNPDKVKRATESYWERKARAILKAEQGEKGE
ncbi:MAG: phosphatase [Clostridia bacterium]|nr:phosphatase [Clostridia bacterium]